MIGDELMQRPDRVRAISKAAVTVSPTSFSGDRPRAGSKPTVNASALPLAPLLWMIFGYVDNVSAESFKDITFRWHIGRRVVPVENCTLWVEEIGATSRRHFIATCSAAVADHATSAPALEIVVDGGRPIQVPQEIEDVSQAARTMLAALPVESRRQALESLSAAMKDEMSVGGRLELADRLYSLRELLRDYQPLGVISPDAPTAMHIDLLLSPEGLGFYVKGWLWAAGPRVQRLLAISPEGMRIDVGESLIRHPRPDVAEFFGESTARAASDASGFVLYFETPVPSPRKDGWIFEIETTDEHAFEVHAPPVHRALGAQRDLILRDLAQDAFDERGLRKRALQPILERIEGVSRATVRVVEDIGYGNLPSAPDVSVIVPIYRRMDFVGHQLLQFSLDEEFQSVELVFVLDSPEQRVQFREYTSMLSKLYRVPFRTLTLNQNGGFATANNCAAELAKGRLLLFLNSDIVPSKPGWVGQMKDFHDATPSTGIVGPKLLYEDGSLQHAGIYFSQSLANSVWSNDHYFKGLHADLPAANMTRRVPAVTGACLLIDANLFRTVGGFSASYIQGDYEDSDLCLRVLAEGFESWYIPTVELYHLEGQSYPSEFRQLNAEYNRWLHSNTWSEQIQALAGSIAE